MPRQAPRKREPIKLQTHGDTKHYCRECRKSFKPLEERGTPHLRCFLHVRDTHPGMVATILCGPYCRQREQPDEKHARRKIHGYGARKGPPPIMTFEQAYPAGEDDHS